MTWKRIALLEPRFTAMARGGKAPLIFHAALLEIDWLTVNPVFKGP